MFLLPHSLALPHFPFWDTVSLGALVGPAPQLCRPQGSHSLISDYLCLKMSWNEKASAIILGTCFFLFYYKVAFHYMDKTPVVYRFTSLWTFEAFPPKFCFLLFFFLKCCKQSCSSRLCANLFMALFSFLLVKYLKEKQRGPKVLLWKKLRHCFQNAFTIWHPLLPKRIRIPSRWLFFTNTCV